MKKSILIYLFSIALIFILFSCGKETNQNPITSLSSTNQSINEKLRGIWQLSNTSGDADKNITYIFDGNNSCRVLKGKENSEDENSYTYEVVSKFNSDLVFIKDSKKNSTIFAINSIDNSKMRVVFYVINNMKIKGNVEIELRKINS